MSDFPRTVAEQASDLIDAGPEHVTTETPTHVLVYLTRRYVKEQHRVRARAEARRVETEVRRVQAANRPKRRTSAEFEADMVRDAYHAAATRAILAARDRWQELQDQEFALPDGSMVTWAEATIDDHQARAASQRRLAAGIETDAAMHERAASDLYTFGVYRLGDLGTIVPDINKMAINA